MIIFKEINNFTQNYWWFEHKKYICNNENVKPYPIYIDYWYEGNRIIDDTQKFDNKKQNILAHIPWALWLYKNILNKKKTKFDCINNVTEMLFHKIQYCAIVNNKYTYITYLSLRPTNVKF